MPDFMPCFACFGFILWLLPLILCIVLFSRVHALTARLQLLESRFADFARDLLRRPIPAIAADHPLTPPAPIPLVEPAPPKAPPPHPAAPAPIPTPAAPHPTIPPIPLAPVPPPPAPPAPRPARVSSGKSLETYIFTKGFVVLGAIILALTAIFLVKIGIDRGIFNAQLRDIAGFSAGIALIALGQWRRRHEGFWSQGIIAAGIISLFAATFAAATLHHLISPLTGFVLLALTTAAAVAMSLQNWAGARGDNRGGLLIATLGLVGGFITPILVNTGHDNVPGLFGYLLLLHVGLVAATRLRGWSILAAASVLLSSFWLLLWTLFKWDGNPADGTLLGLFMLGTVCALVLSTLRRPEKWARGASGFAAISLTWFAVALALLSACTLLGRSHFDNLQWSFFALLLAGAFFLARLRPLYEGMAWLASFTLLLMLIAWGAMVHMMGDAAAAEHLRLQNWLMGFGLASSLTAYACLWRSAVPFRWSLLSTTLAVAYVATAYWILPAAPRPEVWAWLPTAAAFALLLLAIPIYFRRSSMVTGEQSLAAFALAMLALLTIAAPMAFTHAPLTAAWAALLPLTALAAWRLRIPMLLIGFLILCGFLTIRAAMIPSLFDSSDGRTLFWNPIVWTYGSLLLAAALSAKIVEQIRSIPLHLRGLLPPIAALSSYLQSGATASAFLLLTLLVRWHFHNGRLDDFSTLLLERGTFVAGSLLLAVALLWLGRHLGRPVLAISGQVISVIALLFSVVVLLLIANPFWSGDIIRPSLLLNELTLVYGIPAALCALLAHMTRARPIPPATDAATQSLEPQFSSSRLDAALQNAFLSFAAGTVGFLLLTMMVTLQVRHGFAPTLGAGSPTFAEWSTYAIAWITLGLLSLAFGMRFHRILPKNAGALLASFGLVYAIAIPGIIMSPIFHHQSVGATIFFNQLLYAYGIPILLSALTALTVHPRAARFLAAPPDGRDLFFSASSVGRIARASLCILLFILVTSEIRQYFQGPFLDADAMSFFERGTYPIAWFALAAALLAFGHFFRSQVVRRAGLTTLSIAIGFVVLICALVMNPLWTGESVGATLIFNGLLYSYGIPAAATAVIAWIFWKRFPTRLAEKTLAWISAIASLFLVFTFVTLEVQHAFRGDHLSFSPGPGGEFTAYSLAWSGLGALYLIMGIFTRSPLLRWASLVMLLTTIVKVFLFDMADLKDFERVLSFAGLGLALMALAFIYQRFVFRKPQSESLPDNNNDPQT